MLIDYSSIIYQIPNLVKWFKHFFNAQHHLLHMRHDKDNNAKKSAKALDLFTEICYNKTNSDFYMLN